MKEIDKNELELLRKKAEKNVKNVISNNKRRKSKEDKIDNDNLEEKNYNFKIDEEKKLDNNNNKEDKKNEKKLKKEKKINEKKLKKEKKIKEKKTKKEKEPFNGKKLLLKLFFCIVIATFLTIILFYFLDKFIYKLNNVDLLKESITGLQKSNQINTGIVITEEMKSVQYSYNNKYYTYLNQGKVYIKRINDNTDVSIIESENEICYYHLLYDKNLIYYITKQDSQYSTYLQIWTYDITSRKTSEFNEFTVSGFVRIKDMEYSPLVNIIYLNVERNSNGQTQNIIYRLDLFNNMYKYSTNIIANKMVMLKQEDALYFEADSGINYYKGYMFNIFSESVDLMGVDLDDKVYFISSNRTTVYVVKNRKIINTIELKDTNMITWYSDNTYVYIIYPEYVLNISSQEDPFKKVGKMSNYMTFQCIKSDTMYLLTRDNRVILTKLDV